MFAHRAVRTLAALVLALGLAIAPGLAAADELDDARAAGLVGETIRGYIAPVNAATPQVSALVDRINAARRVRYEEIAERTGSTREQVEALAAARVIESAPPGTYIMDQSGAWRQK